MTHPPPKKSIAEIIEEGRRLRQTTRELCAELGRTMERVRMTDAGFHPWLMERLRGHTR